MPKNCYKRGGVWWARASVQGQEYRESLHIPVAGTTQRQAEAAASKWLDRLLSQIRGDAPARTFDEIALHFLDHRLPELRPRGAERYRVSLRALLHFEGMALEDIGTPSLRAFESARRAEGVTASTIRRDLQCLSAAIQFFGDSFDLDMPNPVQRYLRRRKQQGALTEGAARTRYLSHDEESRLLSDIRRRAEPRLMAECVAFAIDTGLRLEEQFSLEWRDVRDGRIHVREGKGGKSRVVPLLARSAQILAHLPRHIRSPYVWAKPDGDRWHNRGKAFGNACKRVGITDIRWHDLRRTCGCRRLQGGWSMEQVRDLLGHGSVVTTERSYAFLEVENLESVGTKNGTGQTDI